jgi:hypothetical protein
MIITSFGKEGSDIGIEREGSRVYITFSQACCESQICVSNVVQ